MQDPENTRRYLLLCVSVVVVVTGAGTVVCEDVVVVLWVGSLAHAESAARVTAIRLGMRSLFMGIVLLCIVVKEQSILGNGMIVGYGVLAP